VIFGCQGYDQFDMDCFITRSGNNTHFVHALKYNLQKSLSMYFMILGNISNVSFNFDNFHCLLDKKQILHKATLLLFMVIQKLILT